MHTTHHSGRSWTGGHAGFDAFVCVLYSSKSDFWMVGSFEQRNYWQLQRTCYTKSFLEIEGCWWSLLSSVTGGWGTSMPCFVRVQLTAAFHVKHTRLHTERRQPWRLGGVNEVLMRKRDAYCFVPGRASEGDVRVENETPARVESQVVALLEQKDCVSLKGSCYFSSARA